MDTTSSSVRMQQLPPTLPSTPSTNNSLSHIKMLNYSPASPASSISSESMDITLTPSSTCYPASATTSRLLSSQESDEHFCTPKKSLADSGVLERIRGKLGTPGSFCGDMPTLRPEQCGGEEESVKMLKNRFLISTQVYPIPPEVAAKTPSSYRHLIDRNASNLRCTDVFTEKEYICKIINEPFDKVQRAYFDIKHAGDRAKSSIYGHTLIRNIHDIVPKEKNRSYLIFALPQASEGAEGIYEDLHTYIRNKRRLGEDEARALFHQISETVLLCHQNGIILRDLKLKRFYFIDEARTKIQYESLEGSMILNDPADDTLSDKIGCPLYTAPELLCPQPTYHGKPADMWSLGVILYTMLVGQYPFYERGNCNLITIIRHCQVQIPNNLTRSVRCLLLLLLCKNYKDRLHAQDVFLTPWVKEQKPFGNLFLHVDTNVDDWLMDDEDDAANNDNKKQGIEELSAQQRHYEKYCKNHDVRAMILQQQTFEDGASDEEYEEEESCEDDDAYCDYDDADCDISICQTARDTESEENDFDALNVPLL
ncbi:tribbles [Eurosta solidaginis]|uniref:tribbles n=1 Tax=Eurosta solidaginis TaxID=178769 RepID=UPI003530A4F4